MVHKGLAGALLLLCIAAGATAQDTSKPIADLLFVLSSDAATFTTANTLTMENVTITAQFYGKGARAGVTPTGAFVNATAGAQYVATNGQWLNNPTATLYGFASNSTGHAVIMTLSSPQADSANRRVTFDVAVVTDASGIKTKEGVANEEEVAAANMAGYLLSTVQPGTELFETSLFIDVNSESVTPEAQTKDWYRPYYGYGGCWGGCGYYGYRPYYGGWGGGYGRGWGHGWGK